MIQFSKQELEAMLSHAHDNHLESMDYANEVELDENNNPVKSFDYVNHCAMMSIAGSLLVIADSLTAMRFESRSSDITRIADNLNDVFNAIEAIERRLP